MRWLARTVALGLLASAAQSGWAAPPTLQNLFPAGGERGRTVTVEIGGSFDAASVRGWSDPPGLMFAAGPDKGKLTVSIPPDAAPGRYAVRLADAAGASEIRAFAIGTIGEMTESEPNDALAKAQPIASLPITINGRLGRSGDVDAFAMRLERGQVLAASVAGQGIGSPMDAMLQVAQTDGIVLTDADDTPDRDPALAFEAPRSGTYLVRLFAFPAEPDTSIRFAGGSAYIYRLTLTCSGNVQSAFPPVLSRQGMTGVEPVGFGDFEGAGVLDIDFRTLSDADRTVAWRPGLAGEALVRVVDHPSVIEIEPNDAQRPGPLAPPMAINGRIDPPGDVDTFTWDAPADTAYSVKVLARGLGRPVDPVLRIVGPDGATLADVDDTSGRDPSTTFTARRAGSHRIEVRDLHGRGGPERTYALFVEPSRPEWSLGFRADRYAVEAGKSVNVPVDVRRDGGFSGEIVVSAEDLPLGVSAEPVVSKPGDATAKEVTLVLQGATAATTSGAFRIVGRFDGTPRFAGLSAAPSGGGGRSRRNAAPPDPFAGFLGRPLPWLTITTEAKK